MTNKIVAAQAGDDNWGYAPDHSVAPDQWPKYYATGAYQSPINILVDHCERLKGSTCCHSRPLDEQCPATRLRDSLQVTPAAAKRRSHLDSAGEDQRHVNGSSGSSSKSSSPSQHFYGQDDYDEDEHENSSGSARDCKETNSNNNNNNNDNQINRCYQKQAVLQQNTRFCVSHKKIFLGYPRYLSTMQLCNTGHGWQVNLPGELATHTLLAGPPLADREYRLAQFHCHWGEDCYHGSEHQINGKSFAAELHFVHWNCTEFRSIEEASRHKHGLAVLAVFVQALEGEQNLNKHLEKIVSGLRKIQRPNSSTAIHARLDLKKLFPANRWTYASYEGSLTTPPLSEVVDWVVFLNPIQCSTGQIEEFRQLQCPSGERSNRLRKNCRPVQPSNKRLVSIWTHH